MTHDNNKAKGKKQYEQALLRKFVYKFFKIS